MSVIPGTTKVAVLAWEHEVSVSCGGWLFQGLELADYTIQLARPVTEEPNDAASNSTGTSADLWLDEPGTPRDVHLVYDSEVGEAFGRDLNNAVTRMVAKKGTYHAKVLRGEAAVSHLLGQALCTQVPKEHIEALVLVRPDEGVPADLVHASLLYKGGVKAGRIRNLFREFAASITWCIATCVKGPAACFGQGEE